MDGLRLEDYILLFVGLVAVLVVLIKELFKRIYGIDSQSKNKQVAEESKPNEGSFSDDFGTEPSMEIEIQSVEVMAWHNRIGCTFNDSWLGGEWDEIDIYPGDDESWYNQRCEFENWPCDETLWIKIQSRDPDTWHDLGCILADLGRHDEAFQAFEKAIQLKPDHTQVWYDRARIHSLLDQEENALSSLRVAIALDSSLKKRAKVDPDFENLWDDEDFKKPVE